MIVFVLHGFGGNISTSNTITTLKTFETEDIKVIPIDYDSSDALKSFDTISHTIKQHYDSELVFVGISLGGFWARFFANQHPNSKLIMINPALSAPQSLSTKVGDVINDHTITNDLCINLQPFQITNDIESIAINVIIGINDEVIPTDEALSIYKDRGKVHQTSQPHRITYGKSELDFINKALYNISG